MISVLHKKRRNPLIEDFDDSNYDTYDTDITYTNERGAAERP